jgi:hypothetical protein
MTLTTLFSGSPVGSPSVMHMTKMGFGNVPFCRGTVNRGRMILASKLVPRGVIPSNLTRSTSELASALLLMLLPFKLEFMKRTVRPSSSNREATSDTLDRMAFRSLMRSPPETSRSLLLRMFLCHMRVSLMCMCQDPHNSCIIWT